MLILTEALWQMSSRHLNSRMSATLQTVETVKQVYEQLCVRPDGDRGATRRECICFCIQLVADYSTRHIVRT